MNMVKKFKALKMTEDMIFDESIEVKGDITGYYNLTVAGSIKAGNINARDIDALEIRARGIKARDIEAWDIEAWDIEAWDIEAWDIDARNIDAWDIDAWDIVCETIRLKDKAKGKIRARSVLRKRSASDFKEWESD